MLNMPADFEFCALEKAANYRAALLEEFTPFLKGNVIELGAGIGQFTAALAAIEGVQRLVSVEPDLRFGEEFGRRHPGRELVAGTLASVPDQAGWDALVSINVLEHVRGDAAELARWRHVLAQRRGNVCLFVPARPELFAPIDADFGHFRRYTRPELRRKLQTAGFRIHRLHYFNLAGYFGWWLFFCLLKKRHFHARSVSCFDRLVFPVTHFLERRLARPPFGQSLLAVAQASAFD